MGPGRSPIRLKVAGTVLATIGGLALVGATLDVGQVSRWDSFWEIMCYGLAPLLAGVGLILNARWAWVLALLVAVAGIVLGLYLFVQPGDITAPGAGVLGLFVFALPGLFVAAMLLTPRSLRWLTSRTDATPSGSPVR